jgi:hypothetical protein
MTVSPEPVGRGNPVIRNGKESGEKRFDGQFLVAFCAGAMHRQIGR